MHIPRSSWLYSSICIGVLCLGEPGPRRTLYKHSHSSAKTLGLTLAMSKSTTSPDQNMLGAPLKSSCDVMPAILDLLNSIPDKPFNCSLSQPPCYQLTCNVTSTRDILQVTHMPCSSPPMVHIMVKNVSNATLFNVTLAQSRLVSINFTNATIPTNITIIQHTDYLTLGESVRFFNS